MISKAVKIQLVIFAIVTLVGGAFVGGKYAQVDRLVVDRTFPVTATFSDSGGIFAGAQVTYRGIAVGKVGKLTFVKEGVKIRLDIEKSAPKIPDDLVVAVANKSAIGEQFVDLQPRRDTGPFLKAGSTVPTKDTRVPIDASTLLIDINDLVKSVDTESLQTLIDELGRAFEGTGRDLGRIIDTSTEFVTAAQENIGVTQQLIRSSSSVLRTQMDKQSELATFSSNLAKFSDTLVDADPDLRRLLDQGTSGAKEIREVVDENQKDLTSIFNDLRIATVPLDKYHKGLEAIAILYPYLVDGGYSVIAPSKRTGSKGEFDATFGLIATGEPPQPGGSGPVCRENQGDQNYRPIRTPDQLGDVPFNVDTDCKNAKKVPRTPSKSDINLDRAGVASTSGKDSWTWLLLGPATS